MSLFEATPRAAPDAHQPDARDWLRSITQDHHQPLVVFGVAWCGFCRAALNLLDAAGTPYLYIDTEDRSALAGVPPLQARTALRELTGSRTVPQIFLGGESLGGASELYSAWRDGRLAALLEPLGLPFEEPH